MRILALTSSYPRYEGDPTAPFIESITKHVAELGHSVDVVLPESSAWNRPPVEGNVTYHPYRYSPRRSWTPWGYSEALAQGERIRRSLYALAPVVAASGLRTARRLLARERYDVVHAHWVIPNGPIAARAARGRALPLVVSLHGADATVAERSRPVGSIARSTFDQASAVTAPSTDLLERARRLGAHEPLELVPYGADVSAVATDERAVEQLRTRLGIPSDRLVVTGIGRFVTKKGFSYLVEAFVQARAVRGDLQLVFAGDGDLRSELEEQVAALGASAHVTFAGMADRATIPAHLGLADMVVVPSIRTEGHVDGLPNVALEAMAAGKPLVATRVGGLPELVRDGENGVLVDEKDAAGLSGAILALAGDPGLRARLGASAREEIRVERSWEAVARRFVEVYERAVARR
jgi:glycosyltransferase involved in cell wall biosynthesis